MIILPRRDRAQTSAASILPGLGLVLVATAAAMLFNALVPAVSPLLIAILAGALLANTVSLPAALTPGLALSAKRLLRVGVALLGLQLVLGDIFALGWGVIAVVVAVVVLGIFGTMWLGARLGLSWSQRVLIACGFSICGAAAVAAADGVIDAEEEETVTAIALVVVFGTLMILAVPLLAAAFGLGDEDAGMWAGASIHEVAQVVAAGGAIGGGALAVAVVVKLARVLMLAPVLTVLGLVMRRRAVAEGAVAGESKRPPLVPLFVAMFLALVLVRSTGVVPDSVLDIAKFCGTALLTAAMFALGAGVQVATMRKVGPRPFILAAAATVWVAGIALGGVLLVG
ncbi:YeiH family protein [Tomitella biformata]|uniref:YeiH family protein n=1 Tax=Tomitella biformata TaxID=630403 RepID=UPI000466FC93|nr:putative sulfate exporter family transporter [Tomitella biformata]